MSTPSSTASSASLFSTTPTLKSVIATSNTTIFGMASLMQKVRALNTQASMLRPSDTAGVDALRKQVNDALGQFNTIATAVQSSGSTGKSTAAVGAATLSTGALTASNATTGTNSASAAAPASLDELRKTLASMQNNLHDNITKIGVNLSKALMTPQPTTTSSSNTNAWALLYAKTRSSGSSYL